MALSVLINFIVLIGIMNGTALLIYSLLKKLYMVYLLSLSDVAKEIIVITI